MGFAERGWEGGGDLTSQTKATGVEGGRDSVGGARWEKV